MVMNAIRINDHYTAHKVRARLRSRELIKTRPSCRSDNRNHNPHNENYSIFFSAVRAEDVDSFFIILKDCIF